MNQFFLVFVFLTLSSLAIAEVKSPFELAIEANDVEKIQKLIDNGEDVNQKFGYFKQPAISKTLGFKERFDALVLLLKNGADVNAVDIDNSAAIDKAARFGSYEALKILPRFNS